MKGTRKETTRDRVYENILKTYRERTPPSALLLVGPWGSKIEELAERLSMALLCQGDDPPCLACRSCTMFEGKSHPSYFPLHPEKGEIRIGMVRELARELIKKGFYGDRRAVLIQGADRLNRNASNSLLKVLEEPPAGTFFILTSGSSGKIRATIRSRCATFNIPPFSPEDLDNHRESAYPGLDPKKGEMAKHVSEGSIDLFDFIAEGKVKSPGQIVKTLAGRDHRKITEVAAALKEEDLFSPSLMVIKRALLDLIMLSMGEKGCIIKPEITNLGKAVRLISDPQKLVESFYIISSLETMPSRANRSLICESVLLSLSERGA